MPRTLLVFVLLLVRQVIADETVDHIMRILSVHEKSLGSLAAENRDLKMHVIENENFIELLNKRVLTLESENTALKRTIKTLEMRHRETTVKHKGEHSHVKTILENQNFKVEEHKDYLKEESFANLKIKNSALTETKHNGTGIIFRNSNGPQTNVSPSKDGKSSLPRKVKSITDVSDKKLTSRRLRRVNEIERKTRCTSILFNDTACTARVKRLCSYD